MSDSYELSELTEQILAEHRLRPRQFFYADLLEDIDEVDNAYQELLDADLVIQTDATVSVNGNPRKPYRLKDE